MMDEPAPRIAASTEAPIISFSRTNQLSSMDRVKAAKNNTVLN